MEESGNVLSAPKSTEKNVEFQKRNNKNRPKSKKLEKRNNRIPLYLNSLPAMVVFVKSNGKLNPVYRIVGFSLDEILMNCTKIMKLTSAARKLYSNHGQLIESFDQLVPYEEVFVSLGEPYIDPIKLIKKAINIKAESFWGLNGLYIPKTKRTAVSASPNCRSSKVWRILTFANREYSVNEAIEIISDLKDIEEAKAICSTKHNFNGQCKRLFTSDYSEIFDLKSLCDEESFVWNANNNITILGPLWASKGEDLNQEGVYNYFLNCKMSLQNMLNESRSYLKELEEIESGDVENVPASKMKSFSKPELRVQKEKTESKIEKIEKMFQKFQDKLQILPKPISQSITEPDKDLNKSTYKSTKGLRLKVYQNGQDGTQYLVIFFNVHKAKRGINDSALLFSRFLDYLSENVRLSQLNDFSKGILVRRVFTETGEEIKNVDQLSYDQLICVSYGDEWIDPIFICACANIHLLNNNLEGSAYDFEINSKSLKEFEVSKKCDEKYQFYNLPVFQHQKKSDMFFVTSLTAKDRKDKKNNLMTSWTYTAKGRMILKSVPSLCLTLLPGVMDSLTIDKSSLSLQKLETGKHKSFDVNTYPVQLCLIEPHEPNQMWQFNNSGLLSNKGYPGFFLTYCEPRSKTDKDELSENIINSNIIAAEIFPDDLQMYQRWAFKQESFGNLNQWRLCDLPNPQWHKTALTWPLKSDGELNTNLTWPIEGLLVPCVPPLTRRKYDSEMRFPIKLMVFKNNDHTMKKPTLVAGPDLSKLIKKGKDIPYETHCTNETLLKLEFQMFLDNCTNTLKLPSAARRLFDQYGDEKFDLGGLSNNDLVYASMGEMWCSPDKTLSRIELRSYCNKLSADIERMRFFISLQLVNDEFVIGVKGDSLEESGIVEIQLLNEQSKREIQRIIDEDNFVPIPEPIEEPSIDETLKYKTFHERNCDAAKLRLKNVDQVEDEKKEEISVEKIKPSPPSDINLQQFVYKSNQILVMNNQRFGLCADDIGKHVIIKALPLTIENYRSNWILHNSGSIESAHYRGFVLAVRCHKMLHFQDKAPPGYLNCVLVLEKAMNVKYGKGHQRFKIDARSGLFYPFDTNSLDRSITAALLAGICTKFVTSKPISQPGFLLEINSEQKASCLSCVSVMSGRFPQSALDDDRKGFACFHSGGFKVVDKTADLSSLKSEETYISYVNKLEDIRKQLTIKICKGRYMESSNENIQVLLHLNGNKKVIPPRKVTGKSIDQIMEIATALFNLQRPVRILYTIKGEEIYDDLSFRTIVGQLNPDSGLVVEEDKVKQISNKGDSVQDVCNENPDSDFDISLSDDQRFFIIEFIGNLPSNLYTLQINIVSIDGINIFQELHASQDSAFLFNYEIFNNQINTELFVRDFDFEGEQTELSIKSSPSALIHLFTKVMTTLRLQLISARVNKEDNSNEFKVDIESIDALADFHFDDLVKKLQAKDFKRFSMKLAIPLLSTETFMATTASVTVEVNLNEDSPDISRKNGEIESTSNGSVITEPNCFSSNIPVELWASIGEPFVVPGEEKVSMKRKTKNFILFQQLKLEIDKKRFLLRTMKGDRLKRLNSGTLEGTPSETNPVKIKDNWQFPTINEIKLGEEIEDLQNKLSAMRNPFKEPETKQIVLSRNLYKQRNFKKVLVHLNGERENTAVPIWCECIWDILQNSVTPLGMKRTPKYIFKRNGKLVSNFNEISTGETLSVSNQSTFMSPKDSELQCEIKANWGRSRRMYGENSTDLKVQYRHNTVIDIDPFSPPDVMKHEQENPEEPKTIKIYENGQPRSTAREITGRCLMDFLKSSTTILKLTVPVKCLYAVDGRRITGFREILHDDLLAASVSGKGLVESGDE